MKRLLLIVALMAAVLSFNSCEEDQFGYDNRVVFSANGGTEDVDGDRSIYHLSIGDYAGNEKSATEIAGIMTVTYDWLTVTAVKGDDEIHLVAAPNKTGKRRKLYVYGAIDNRSTDITVIQDK